MIGWIVAIMIVFLLFLIAGFISIVVWLKKEDKDPTNPAILINNMSQQTDGYKILIVKKRIEGEKKVGFKCVPRDIDWIEAKNDNVPIKEYTVFFWKNQQELLSTYPRTIYEAYPPRKELLPNELKGTSKEKIVSEFIENQDQKMKETDIFRTKEKNIQKTRLQDEGLQIIGDYSNNMWDIIKNTKESVNIPNRPNELKKEDK